MDNYELIQFDMAVPDAITERFAKWFQVVASNPAIVPGKPIGLSLKTPDGDTYKDSTFHAQMYRALKAYKDGAKWAQAYPALARGKVRYIHKRTALTVTSKAK
jgi:hypothetical protein